MEIIIIVILTLLNAVFALSEIALVSAKRHSIEELASQDNSRAKIVLKLMDDPENFLSSVQVGITLIGVVAGAYGAAQLVDDVEPLIANIGFLAGSSTEIAFVLIIALITYFSIVVGELIPKTIALTNPEKIALIFGPIINVFSKFAYPLVKLLSGSTKLFLRLIGIKEANNSDVSSDELVQMLKTASRQGVIQKDESLMHQNIFMFSEQRAKGLKTHRSEVEWINLNDDFETITDQIKNSPYSKFPVCKKNVDNIVGLLTAKDFFEYADQGTDLAKVLKDPIFIPEMMSAIDVLRLFKKKKEYLGFVVDEYGSFEGILTLHDLIESIVGDLPDAEEDGEHEFILREDGSVLVSGSAEVDDLNVFLKTELVSIEPENYMTLAGFIIYHLGRLPETGEHFEYNGYKFEVVDTDGTRIDKLIIKALG